MSGILLRQDHITLANIFRALQDKKRVILKKHEVTSVDNIHH
jgi:hypothetical protein